MAMIAFLVFFGVALQGILCRCDFLAILAVVCLISSCVLALAPSLPRWARICTGMISISLLAIVIYWAGWFDMLYLGRISEYRYAGVEAAGVILLHFLALLPDSKKKVSPARKVSVRDTHKNADAP